MKPIIKYDVGIVGAGPVGLILSNLLKYYNISHYIIDRKTKPTTHPQAHFINNRSMEIFQSCMPQVFNKINKQISDSKYWRYSFNL